MGKKQSKVAAQKDNPVLPPSQSLHHIVIPNYLVERPKFMFIGNHTFLIPTQKLDDLSRRLEYTNDWVPIDFVIDGKENTEKVVLFSHSESLAVVVTCRSLM